MKLQINFNENPNYSSEYLELHKKFDVPLHGLTPEQTRFYHYAFRNEVNVFFRKCNKSGQTILSQFPSETDFPVYRHDLWWGDDWDALSYGRDFDFSRGFFEQFHELQLKVPRMSVACDTSMENCPFVNCVNQSKNCHMIFASGNCDDCFYSVNLERSRTTMDASICFECELCYEVTSSRNCYNLDFSTYCVGCFNSQFLYDCRRCKNCFLCVGLEDKQYCIRNVQYSREEYEATVKDIFPLTHEKIEMYFEEMEKVRLNYVHKSGNLIASENCAGNDISNSQNSLNCYIHENSQNCINGSSLRHCKDCLDFDIWGDPGELCYNCVGCGYNSYNLKMCFDCWNNCNFLTYCDSCPGCSNCFGCVGLKNKKYCIFNRQYSEVDYEQTKTLIIEHMKANGEYGKWFPSYCSPYSLNSSMAHEYFHMDELLAKDLGFQWMDRSEEYKYDPNLLYAGIMYAPDIDFKDLSGKYLLCSLTKKPFNIQARELEILKIKKLPLPDKHWRTRLELRDERFIFPWKLEERKTVEGGNVMSVVPEKYQISKK